MVLCMIYERPADVRVFFYNFPNILTIKGFNMARQIQIRRGTTLENDNFTGAIGEITMDTDAKTLRVHDGETVGGVPLAKESEIPDLSNLFNNILPDYTAGVTKSANTTHTAECNGWILLYHFSNDDRYFFIDGIRLHFGAGNSGSFYSGNGIFMPIAKGQTFMGYDEITFFPCVGV